MNQPILQFLDGAQTEEEAGLNYTTQDHKISYSLDVWETVFCEQRSKQHESEGNGLIHGQTTLFEESLSNCMGLHIIIPEDFFGCTSI